MTRKLSLTTREFSIPAPLVERRIYVVRGQKVMLSHDLAALYGVATKVFNQTVNRNRRRFPEDFMFRLTLAEGNELQRLRSQFVTLKRGRHIKYAPYAFTQEGVAMLSSVLKSERAIMVNIAIMRAFTRLRELAATHKDLGEKLDALDVNINVTTHKSGRFSTLYASSWKRRGAGRSTGSASSLNPPDTRERLSHPPA